MSTATQNPYTLDKYSDKEWEAAIREVELKEMMVKYTQMQIVSGRLNPHLHYQLFPFLISGSPSKCHWSHHSLVLRNLPIIYNLPRGNSLINDIHPVESGWGLNDDNMTSRLVL